MFRWLVRTGRDAVVQVKGKRRKRPCIKIRLGGMQDRTDRSGTSQTNTRFNVTSPKNYTESSTNKIPSNKKQVFVYFNFSTIQ